MLSVPQFDQSAVASTVDDADATETCILSVDWQQKFFSAKELSRYLDSEKCQTDLHKRYHLQCTSRSDRDEPLIFTYIAEDDFVPSAECVAANQEHFSGFTKVSSQAQQRPKGDDDYVIMRVMADLIENVETVLFTITWKANERLLLVFPDFNNLLTNPYVKDIDSDRRQLYRYSIENISETKPTDVGNMTNSVNLQQTFRFCLIMSMHFSRCLQSHFSHIIRWACLTSHLGVALSRQFCWKLNQPVTLNMTTSMFGIAFDFRMDAA